MMVAMSTLWDRMFLDVQPSWLVEIAGIQALSETRRKRAAYDTGTIGTAACLCLFALCQFLQPKTIVEIGTFIGTSTMCLRRTGHVYTCDKDNNCFEAMRRVSCYPKTRSTKMFQDLVARGIQADLFFFDGRIKPDDTQLIQALSTRSTVYAFDDFEGTEKGVINVGNLKPHLCGYELVLPAKTVPGATDVSTIALLVPGALV